MTDLDEPHSPRHEELLARVSLGELAPDAPEVGARARACAVCRHALEESRRLRALLEAGGRADRALVADAAARADAGDRARVARALGRVADAPRRPPRPWWALTLAAAALVGVALLLVRGREEAATPERTFLGGEWPVSEGVFVRPAPEAQDFSVFEWTWEARPGESFTLEIWPGGDLDAEPIRERGLKGSTWTPGERERESFGEFIRFRLSRVGSGDELRAQARGESRLRSSPR